MAATASSDPPDKKPQFPALLELEPIEQPLVFSVVVHWSPVQEELRLKLNWASRCPTYQDAASAMLSAT
jgi:hypothetical protein